MIWEATNRALIRDKDINNVEKTGVDTQELDDIDFQMELIREMFRLKHMYLSSETHIDGANALLYLTSIIQELLEIHGVDRSDIPGLVRKIENEYGRFSKQVAVTLESSYVVKEDELGDMG